MSLRKFTYTFLFLLFSIALASRVSAQVMNRKDAAKKAQDEKAESVAKALKLLEKVVAPSQSLKLFANRIYIKLKVASIVWPHDEKRAQALYKDAVTEFVSAINDFDISDMTYSEYSERIQIFPSLRSLMIVTLAHEDPEMALDFIHTTRPLMKLKQFYVNKTDGDPAESQLEMSVAESAATKEPKLALQIARENLKKGYQYELTRILQSLRSKDKNTYDTLLKEILAKLEKENFLTDQGASGFATNLLSMLRSDEDDQDKYRELLMSLTSALADSSSDAARNETDGGRILLRNLRSYSSDIEKYAPSQAPALKKRFAEIDNPLEAAYSKEMDKITQLAQNKTADEIVEASKNAAEQYRNQYYRQAMWKALDEKNYQRAVQIAESDNFNPIERKQYIDQINRRRLGIACSEGNIDEVRRLVASMKNVGEIIQNYIQLADMVGRENPEKALQALQEASSFVSERTKNSAEMSARLQLARAYIPRNSDRGAEVIKASISQINDLLETSIKIYEFENYLLQDGELLLMRESGRSGGILSLIMECQSLLVPLARRDFDRAVALADTIQRDEIRLKALVAIAGTGLARGE